MRHNFASQDRIAALEREVITLRRENARLADRVQGLTALAAWALLQDHWKKVAIGQLPLPADPGRLETAGGDPERDHLLSNDFPTTDRKDTESAET